MHRGCIVDVLPLHVLFSTQPGAHDVHRSRRPSPLLPARPRLLSRISLPAPPPSAAPRCLYTSIPFDHTGDSPRCAPRLASPRLRSLFSLPRGTPRSRCNERCTLSSSCSHRRRFHFAAQSVSARLPARFAQRGSARSSPDVTLAENRNARGKKCRCSIASRYYTYRYECGRYNMLHISFVRFNFHR